MPDCTDCGAEVQNKNAAGHYRDRCHECIAEVAGVSPEAAAPINGCACELCQPS
jgi:hypothetical protein